MKLLKFSLLLILLLSVKLSAQVSLETFLSDTLNQPMSVIKNQIADKKIEEKEASGYNLLSYYYWFEPFSVRVTLMFNKKNGKLSGKGISNVKESEDDAQNLFNKSLEVLIKKYGPSISNKTLMGITMYSWSGAGGSVITLARESKKTRLLFMVLK